MAPSDTVVDVAYRAVLVPLDGSALSAAAVPVAIALAQRFGAEVHALSVVEAGGSGEVARRAIAESLTMYGITDAPALSVTEGDDVVGAIEGRVSELDRCLLCLSAHGRGRLAAALMGSVAAKLLSRTEDPAVLVGPSLAEELGFVRPRGPGLLEIPRLVACVDGTLESEAALPVAAAWARELGMSMTVLTVAEPVRDTSDGTVHRRHGPDGDPEAYVAELVARWGDAVAVDGHVQLDPISVGEGVRDHLVHHPAGLVAVTTEARVGRERLIHGSHAAQIVRDAIVPVLVVP